MLGSGAVYVLQTDRQKGHILKADLTPRRVYEPTTKPPKLPKPGALRARLHHLQEKLRVATRILIELQQQESHERRKRQLANVRKGIREWEAKVADLTSSIQAIQETLAKLQKEPNASPAPST